ncbi:MAG: adenylyltransferase/cytidyltransferase family protein [Eubacteriales bacterium]|nr:adenylyltransferase/cytidyltransferase family protein [Eubacteriales bacterium]
MQREDRISGSSDWKVHMQYSPLRRSLFNWYEFRKDASLLELEPESGILTELFRERVREVAAGNEPEAFSRTYDYIIAVGALEKEADPVAAIRKWIGSLKKGGILLLTAENRYGLKYFLGDRPSEDSLPFSGISNELSEETAKRFFTRQELLQILQNAGAEAHKFYYPVPDGRMPQMIFTDAYSNGLNAAERLIDYDYVSGDLLAQEHRVFADMISSGALPFMANTYLMEITKDGKLSDIVYAVPTTDRGEYYGTATTIRAAAADPADSDLSQGSLERGTAEAEAVPAADKNPDVYKAVVKRPLRKAGEENLRTLHRYTKELELSGVPIVETELGEDENGLFLQMPFIRAEGLNDVLKRLVREDTERFLSVFDEIWEYIRRTSDAGRTFLDLAPCNCFYLEDTGSLLFYDQEFAAEEADSGFAMYRTLKYCWQAAPVMQKYVPLEKMYARYGISDFEELEKKEKAFIQGIRNTDRFRQMYVWGTPDREQMRDRCRRIAGMQEEKKKPYRIGYVPGVFDLFHSGHLRLLERCKERCDYLIVGVLTDELVEYYKGHGTVISYADRARVIEGLKVVDEVIPVDFSNTDKLDAWERLHYDCHFSGDDHINHWNDVWEELKKRGSNMEFFSYTQGISSTEIRKKL